ncbi:MAG TPA: hypothetical protein VGG75_19360 [Trebonia sp.]
MRGERLPLDPDQVVGGQQDGAVSGPDVVGGGTCERLGRSGSRVKASALPVKSTENVASFCPSRRSRLLAASADTTRSGRGFAGR